ncbi:MAG TPA: carbohydrate ABC transporter permease [Streptosporangiaceae bacterium]|nr:carbohydrate ABC transporter permease [Streptosporangiaceae bacterium]
MVRVLPGRRRRRLAWFPGWLIGMLAAILWAAPFLWMLSTSFKPTAQILTNNIHWLPQTFVLDNYRFVFRGPVSRWMLNSLITSFLGTLLGVMVGALAGYALARIQFRGRNAVFGLILASIMIPANLAVVPLYIAFLKIGLVNSYAAITLPLVANAVSVYIFRQFFLGLPDELEDAARIDGAGRWQMFIHVALPLARGPITASTIILFTANWNNYLWPLLITFSQNMYTLPVGVAQYSSASGNYTQINIYGPSMAAATLLCIPSLAIFLALQRYFIEGVARAGVKG